MKSNLQLILLRVHMEIDLLLLFKFLLSLLARALDSASWSGREQRGLLINAIVSSSEQTTA